MTQPIVVVGGGLTAAKAVEALRGAGFEGSIVVFGEEHHLPYERPPLSKGYLLGQRRAGDGVRPRRRLVRRATTSTFASARPSPRSTPAPTSCAPPTGSRPTTSCCSRPARPRATSPWPTTAALPVAYLRTIEDSERLKESFGEGRSVVVIGGGWIGLEVAAAAREAGSSVTVLESLDLPLLRVLGPEVAEVFAELHREHGVDLRTGVDVAAIDKDGQRAVVRLGDGSTVEADLVVVGIGVSPNISIAEAAGLDTDNGVLVDERLQTSRPGRLRRG